jgi:hypothetical protein
MVVDGKALDMWALGVTIYSYYYMKVPFFEDTLDGLAKAITDNE